MKILVTGGAGFIGSNLVDALIKAGHSVVIIDSLINGQKEFINNQANFYHLDILDKKIEKVFLKEQPEAVFHLAAQIDLRKSVEDPFFDAKVNIEGSLNVIETARRSGVKKIIFASTAGVYGYTVEKDIPTLESIKPAPAFPYSINKLAIEYYLVCFYKIFNLPYVVLRYANVYGPRQNTKGEAGVIALFIDRLLSGQQATVNGDGQQTRDFIYIDDIVAANLKALEADQVGIYNISTSRETNIVDVFEMISKSAGVDKQANFGLAKDDEQKRSCLDYSLAKKELGWKPQVEIDQGIEKTTAWFKNKLKQ